MLFLKIAILFLRYIYKKTAFDLLKGTKKEKLHTKEKIMITTLEYDTLYGLGFESDSNLKNWKILNPSGVTNRGFE